MLRLPALLVVLALLPSVWLAVWFRDLPQLSVYHDDAIYWVSAQSLAQHGTYRIASLPGEPAQTKYPVGYPALLVPAWLANPAAGSKALAIFATWIWLPLLLGFCWRTFDGWGFATWERTAMCAAIALQPVTVLLATTTMSELPFTALIVAALWMAERDRPVAAGLLGGAAFLMRTAGLPFLATAPLCYALSRKWRSAGLFLAAMLPIVASRQIWVALNTPPGQDIVTLYYANYVGFHLHFVKLADVPWMVWVNFNALAASIGQLFFFEAEEHLWSQPLGWVFTVAAVAGIYRQVRHRQMVQFTLFAVGFCALLVLWHYPPDRRFVYPVLPLAIAGLWTQGRHIAQAGRGSRMVLAGVASVLLCSFAAGLFTALPTLFESQRAAAEQRQPAYDWIVRHTPPDAILFAYDDVPAYLATGRKAVGFPIPPPQVYRGTPDTAKAFVSAFPRFAREQKVGYVLVAPGDFRRDLHDAGAAALVRVLADGTYARPVFRYRDSAVYQVRPESGVKSLK